MTRSGGSGMSVLTMVKGVDQRHLRGTKIGAFDCSAGEPVFGSSGASFVTMMQAADLRERNHLAS